MIYVVAALLVVIMGAVAVAWYYKRKSRLSTERADALEVAAAALKSVNGELRASLERTLSSVAATHDQETAADVETATAAATDAQRAADLLNSLHKVRPGAGGHPAGGVPTPAVPGVPRP